MPNPIFTLVGGQLELMTGYDNTQTDVINDFGAGNTVGSATSPEMANLLLNGGDGTPFGSAWDTNTTIFLGGSLVADNIMLDGGTNTVTGSLNSGSTVNVTVTPFGTAPLGSNTVNLTNAGGTTTVSLSGSANNVSILQGAASTVSIANQGIVTLNGNAANTVSFGAGSSQATIGGSNDDNFGFVSGVTLAGDSNTVTGGDENFTVTGGHSNNNITLGDGTNTVMLNGIFNNITLGGGDNFVNAGTGDASVTILGYDSLNPAAYAPGSDAPQVPAQPTDWVTIAGSGDHVTATYENLIVSGYSVTNFATIISGDGNNSVSLGGTGSNVVTLGNGGNNVSVTGDNNAITVGDGGNGITTTGDGNIITVNDAHGIGTDNVQLGAGANNNVILGMAGGSVTGWAPLGTVTTVSQSGSRQVNVNLHGGAAGKNVSGLTSSLTVVLGDGNDSVTANGDLSTIITGNGNSTITAGGNKDFIYSGIGANTITANGNQTQITAGDGNNIITAIGNGSSGPPPESITVGNGNNTITAGGSGVSGNNETITAGTGTNTISANGAYNTITVGVASPPATDGNLTLSAGSGSNDTISVNASSTSNDHIAIGNNSVLSVTNGTDTISGVAGDTYYLNGTNAGSVLSEMGNNNNTFLGNNSSALIQLTAAATGDHLTVQAMPGSPNNTYTGNIVISGFNGLSDTMDLQGFGFASGAAVLNALTNTNGQETLALPGSGNGSITFLTPTGMTAASFNVSNTTGLVHA